MQYDVEALFEFNDRKKRYSGYRPAHLIKEGYLTTGLHCYYEDNVGREIKGKIAFISPEEYPKSLWVGKKIEMYEGSKMIGTVKILQIFNKILEKDFYLK